MQKENRIRFLPRKWSIWIEESKWSGPIIVAIGIGAVAACYFLFDSLDEGYVKKGIDFINPFREFGNPLDFDKPHFEHLKPAFDIPEEKRIFKVD